MIYVLDLQVYMLLRLVYRTNMYMAISNVYFDLIL